METVWQPIETAPKDGTKVIIFDGQDVHSCVWGEYERYSSSKYAWMITSEDGLMYDHNPWTGEQESLHISAEDAVSWMSLPEVKKKPESTGTEKYILFMSNSYTEGYPS